MKPFEGIKQFLTPLFERIGLPQDWLVDLDFWSWVYGLTISLIGAIFLGIYKLIKIGIHHRKQRFLQKNLNPWFSDEEIDRATRYYIPTYYQNVSPALDEEPGRFHIASATAKLIPLFTKKVFHKTGAKNKFFLILADAGMGKTTFMINLYLQYKRKWMLFRPKYDIVLFPLGRPEALEELDKIDDKAKANTILLLDAFDEDTKALGDYKQRMSDILNKAWRFRAVVITCRTHFFPSEKEQPYLTSQYQFGGEGGEYTFQHLYVSVFSDWDVLRYLHKRFNVLNPFNWQKLWRAWQLTRKSQNLIVRPMLLSHIRDLVKQNRDYEYSYQVYEALIDEWIDRESRKPGIREKYGSVEAFKEKIKIFSQELAVDMYNNREKRGGLFIRYDEPFFSETGMSLSGLEEDWGKAIVKESELRSRALLNRNTENYKFSHKSVLEYFLAIATLKDLKFFYSFDYLSFDTTKIFFNELLFSQILPNIAGYYTLKKSIELIPLSYLSHKDWKNINSLIIRKLDILTAKHFRYLQIDSMKYIILFDAIKNKVLYSFYNLEGNIMFSEYLLENKFKNLPELYSRITQIMTFKTLEANAIIENHPKRKFASSWGKENILIEDIIKTKWYMESSLQNFNNLFESIRDKPRFDIKFQNKSETIAIIKFYVLVASPEKNENDAKDNNLDPITFNDLTSANNFIKECKDLEVALPNVEIYY